MHHGFYPALLHTSRRNHESRTDRGNGVHRPVHRAGVHDRPGYAAGEDIHVAGENQPDWNADIARNLRLLAGLPLEKVEEVYCFCDDVYPMREIAGAIVRALGSSSKVIEDTQPRAFVGSSNERIRKAGGTCSGMKGIEAYARELAEALRK